MSTTKTEPERVELPGGWCFEERYFGTCDVLGRRRFVLFDDVGAATQDWPEDTMRRFLAALRSNAAAGVPFQARVKPWVVTCFGDDVARDELERMDRFVEEVFEAVQSRGYDPARIDALKTYVYGREAGETRQEIGGVQMTLAAWCNAINLDMHDAGEAELARVWTKVDAIRAKQAAKPTGSALPVAASPEPPAPKAEGEADAYMVDCRAAEDGWGFRFWTPDRRREAEGCAQTFGVPLVPLYAASPRPAATDAEVEKLVEHLFQDKRVLLSAFATLPLPHPLNAISPPAPQGLDARANSDRAEGAHHAHD